MKYACTKNCDATQALCVRNVAAATSGVKPHSMLFGMQACVCALGFTRPDITGMYQEAILTQARNANDAGY